MTTPHIDLDALARELGLTPSKAAKYIREAIDAGFLRVVSDDGERIVLEAVIPEAIEPEVTH